AADLSKPIDKRIYKGTQPTCHDFNHLTATAESVSLLVGFSAGQVQLIDPIKKETSKLFNEESPWYMLSMHIQSPVTVLLVGIASGFERGEKCEQHHTHTHTQLRQMAVTCCDVRGDRGPEGEADMEACFTG
ncbi:hypothetical protein EI555_012982, partial [Monodon monoceros]